MNAESKASFSIPDISGASQLESAPQIPNKSASNLGSSLNQNIIALTSFLLDFSNQGDKNYTQAFNSLKEIADKGYVVAQIGLGKFLLKSGELSASANYFSMASQNKHIDKTTKHYLNENAPSSTFNHEEDDIQNKSQNAEKKNSTKQKKKTPKLRKKLTTLRNNNDSRIQHEKSPKLRQKLKTIKKNNNLNIAKKLSKRLITLEAPVPQVF